MYLNHSKVERQPTTNLSTLGSFCVLSIAESGKRPRDPTRERMDVIDHIRRLISLSRFHDHKTSRIAKQNKQQRDHSVSTSLLSGSLDGLGSSLVQSVCTTVNASRAKEEGRDQPRAHLFGELESKLTEGEDLESRLFDHATIHKRHQFPCPHISVDSSFTLVERSGRKRK